ncbi:hypothetical protein HMPREF0372_03756 [Flavonifractor plautii ATCC 29863]|uniref:Uncharacterized protein n=1 Tax=Flavonifractor plautii ATCC 29863 TaxID=411475 RepID=G9YW40_FLAPL|nr:hypothetical protein HMPREF0372_03756 [Flavonifractor plautii ATCC 29863]
MISIYLTPWSTLQVKPFFQNRRKAPAKGRGFSGVCCVSCKGVGEG